MRQLADAKLTEESSRVTQQQNDANFCGFPHHVRQTRAVDIESGRRQLLADLTTTV